MSDHAGFPFPDNAPEPGACIRIERPEKGLAVLYLDPPHRSLAVLDGPLIRDLEAAVAELERDASLHGVVITGRDATQFAAGADVHAIHGISEASLVERVVREVHDLFLRIEELDE